MTHPTSEAQVDTSHEGGHLVDNTHLLVVRPVERAGGKVAGRSLDVDIGVEVSERLLGVAERNKDGLSSARPFRLVSLNTPTHRLSVGVVLFETSL